MNSFLRIGLLAAVSLFASSTIAWGATISIKLADIVGGGNGTGTGTLGNGFDPSSGSTTFPGFYQITQTDNTNSYHSTTSALVNGVFIPDGGAGAVTLDSAGHTFSAFPNTDSTSWDMVRDGPNQNSGTTLGATNYTSGSHSMIGLHANKGITFDLFAIEAAHPGMSATSFTGVAGMTHEVGGYGTADYWVFVDGTLKASQIDMPGGVGTAINVGLTNSNHYLTLVSTDDGDGFNLDQVMFGDPIVTLQPVPEPSAVILLAIGALGFTGIQRRRAGR